MTRTLSTVGVRVLCVGVAAVAVVAVRADGPATNPAAAAAVLERFLSLDVESLTQYRALRRFEARNERFNSVAWMEVWTEADSGGFRYEIAAEGGSDYIRTRVFRGTLETEQRSWAAHAHHRAAVTAINYRFADATIQADGNVRVAVTARRSDSLLVNGWIVLNAETADLVRVEGRLSKSPSVWARGVHIVRDYERIAGVRVPVALETTSRVVIAGQSTFTIRWEYESVNAQRVLTLRPSSHRRSSTEM